ncbi:MAG: hypothetical protein NZM25_00385 [Leptospiraceae bacterium]|nr:hypothetical protein [Leptospiraceae bacterium]MDW8306181.1 hypothetical protein [Leptospiraceae bacterium]
MVQASKCGLFPKWPWFLLFTFVSCTQDDFYQSVLNYAAPLYQVQGKIIGPDGFLLPNHVLEVHSRDYNFFYEAFGNAMGEVSFYAKSGQSRLVLQSLQEDDLATGELYLLPKDTRYRESKPGFRLEFNGGYIFSLDDINPGLP